MANCIVPGLDAAMLAEPPTASPPEVISSRRPNSCDQIGENLCRVLLGIFAQEVTLIVWVTAFDFEPRLAHVAVLAKRGNGGRSFGLLPALKQQPLLLGQHIPDRALLRK